MAATAAELMGRARSFLRDSGGGFIEDTDLLAWINEAITDIAARTQVLHNQVSGTTTGTIPLPAGVNPDLVEIISLRLGQDDVEFIDDLAFNATSDAARTTLHSLARVFKNVIELYPTPVVAKAYTLRYAKIPDALVNGSDIHGLPLQMERKLVEYPVAQGKYKDGLTDEADRWLARYEQGLPRVSNGRERFLTGPLRVTREPNVWDRWGSHV
jgi:hypothetical protein